MFFELGNQNHQTTVIQVFTLLFGRTKLNKNECDRICDLSIQFISVYFHLNKNKKALKLRVSGLFKFFWLVNRCPTRART